MSFNEHIALIANVKAGVTSVRVECIVPGGHLIKIDRLIARALGSLVRAKCVRMIALLNSYVEVEVTHTSQATQPSVLGVSRNR